MQRNYIVTLDGSTAAFMRGPPIIEDTGDSSSENQRSEGRREMAHQGTFLITEVS